MRGLYLCINTAEKEYCNGFRYFSIDISDNTKINCIYIYLYIDTHFIIIFLIINKWLDRWRLGDTWQVKSSRKIAMIDRVRLGL